MRLPLPARDSRGAVRLEVVVVMAVLLTLAAVGTVVLVSRGDADQGARTLPPAPAVACLPKPGRVGPLIDLGIPPGGDEDRVARLVAKAKQAGAAVISTTADWSVLQPDPDASYDWTALDRVIDVSRRAGLKLRVELVGLPSWARDHDTGSAHQPPLTPDELRRWQGFVRDLVRHVEGKVDYLEVWDQPNTEAAWSTGPDPGAFVRLLRATSVVVEREFRVITVVSGGLAGNDVGFLQRVYADIDRRDITPRPFEMVGVDPFSGALAPGAVAPNSGSGLFGAYDPAFTGFRRLHEVMAAHGDEGVPLYLSAFGYSTRAHDGVPAVTDSRRAAYLTDALRAATCSPYVGVFSWYRLEATTSQDAPWSLLGPDLQGNLTYRALADWSILVANAGP